MSRQLVVRGLPAGVDEDDVADFFENKRRGGFDVDRVELDTAAASAVVHFEEEKAVEKILSLGPLEWKKKRLEMKSFAEEQREKEEEARRKEQALSRMLVVRNLPDNVDDDDVADFFEGKKRGGFDVAMVDLNQEEASAIVHFEDEEGVDAVLKLGTLTWKTKTLEVESYRKMLKRKEEEERERERELSCMLMVRGLPKDTDDDDLMDFFEHKKRGGFSVQKVNLDPDASSAVVYFEDEKAVAKLLQSGPYQMMKATLQLSSYREELKRRKETMEAESGETTMEAVASGGSLDLATARPRDLCTVLEVTGLPGKMAEDRLKKFFERRETSGGYTVIKVKLDSDSKSALVHFDDPEAVESTLKRAPFLLDKKQITVRAYTPSEEDSQEEEEEEEGGEGEEKEELRTVAVRGCKGLTSDSLGLYFENARKSEGGQVEECRLDEKEGVAYVTFESAQVAARVSQKTDHEVSGHSLQVSLYREPACYHDRVLLSGLSSKVTKESLINYLEARAHLSPMDILYGEEGTALVTLESTFDLGDLEKVLSQRTLEGCRVKAAKVPFSDAVLVKDVPDDVTKDTMELYFENNRKSGGEDVRRVRKVGQGMWVVNFADPEVASRVSSRGQHKLGKNALQVSLYLECLGPGGGDSDPLSFPLPPPFTLPWPHPLLPRFLKESGPQGQAFRELLERHHAQAKLDDNTKLTVTCTLTRESRDGKRLAKSWKDDVEAAIREFLSGFQWKEVRMTATVFPQVEQDKGQVPVPRERVLVLSQPKDCLFLVLGEPGPVSAAVSAITSLQKQHEEKLEKARQTVTETVSNLEPHKLRFLHASFFPKTVVEKYKGVRVDISLTDGKIIFHGLYTEVKNAQIRMYNDVQNLSCSRAPVSPLVQSLLQNPKVQQKLAKDLQGRRLNAVWEVRNQELVAWAASDQVAVDTVKIVKSAISEQTVRLDPESLPLLDTKLWRQAKSAATKDEEGCVEVRENRDKREVVIAGLDLSTAEDIRNFFTEHTVYSKTLRFPPGRHSFMVQHLAHKIQEIEGNFVGQKVSIRFGEGSQDFKLEGTRIGLERVEENLRHLAASIKSQKHTLSDPNMVGFLQGERGKEVRALVEKEGCVIRDENDPTDQPTVIQGQGREGAGVGGQAYQLPGDRVLHVTQASMTTLHVDVIVNAANYQLQHRGGLAKAIAEKAGPELQQECDAYVRKHGCPKEGEAIVTSAGKLHCQKIIHAVGPRYQGGQRGEEALLSAAVTRSLQEAEKLGMTSIALPAISCGNMGYPEHEATQVIVEAVKGHCQSQASGSLRNVYLCDTNPRTLQCFHKAATKDLPPVQTGSQIDLPGDGPCPGLNIILGELANQQADVLVNTTARYLDLSRGRVSQSLLGRGGQQLQQELNTSYPHGLPEGQDFAVTKGGNLPAKVIYHAVLQNWTTGGEQVLRGLLEKMVRAADHKGYTSMAFPALGTGVLGYPHDVVASSFLHIASTILPACSHLREIRVVIYPGDKDSIEAFRPLVDSSVDPMPSPSRPAVKASRNFSSDLGSTRGVDSQTFHLGDVSIHMKQGDLVEETADVIVNPTNPNLDFGTDGVSGALAKKCGQALQEACKGKKDRKKMHNKGMVSTKAFTLSSKSILHVHAPHFDSLKEAAKACLAKAEKKKATSVAFPVLSTAKESTPEDWAQGLLEAVTELQNKGDLKTVRDVRVVLLDSQALADLAAAVQFLMDNPQVKDRGWMSMIKGFFGGSSPKQRTPAVSIFVFSDKKALLDKVPEKILSYLNKELTKQTIKDDIIKELSTGQTAELRRLEVQHRVTITPSADRSSLEITGLPQHVSSAMNEVLRVLRDQAKHLGESMTAGAMAVYIKWGYMVGDQRRLYDPLNSAALELAFQAKAVSTKIQDASGFVYVVDLDKMEEHPEDDPNDVVKVFRETAGDKAVDLGTLPDSWASMADNEELKIVQLDPADPDYVMVKGEWDKTIGPSPPPSGQPPQVVQPPSTIDSIWRIQNRTLHKQYQSKEQTMNARFPGRQNERRLWFGNTTDNTVSINKSGFDRSKIGEDGSQGVGVYFRASAEEAAQKSKVDPTGFRYVYLSRVLVGEFTTTLHPKRNVPPFKDQANAICYDSVVDDANNPKVFVIFQDTQAYPEFLVKFK